MRLHEYQSKRILRENGVAVPASEVATDPEEARDAAGRIGVPVVLKAQVLVGGRGKAGAIRLAHSADEARRVAAGLLGTEVRGCLVRRVLVEQAIAATRELYLAITLDRSLGRTLIIAAAQGGVEIEEVARAAPEAIFRIALDPWCGLRTYHALNLAKALGLDASLRGGFHQTLLGLLAAFHTCDAQLVEVNPLGVTSGDRLIAMDAKIVLDDNALFRHPDLAELRDVDDEPPAEREARAIGMSYIALDGDIGCIVNGAGLAMATMDTIAQFGGRPANFLDIGGGAKAQGVATALRLVLTSPNVRVVLLNIFGGITRCDEVASGIVEALRETGRAVPLVVRLVGTREEEGRAILEGSGKPLTIARTLEEAARQAVLAATDASLRGQALTG